MADHADADDESDGHRPGTRLRVASIAAHRGFADALVAGLLPRYREPAFGLARLTLILPSSRAIRTVTEAFVRASGAGPDSAGLLLPRMVAIGDLDIDEALGALLDPIGAGSAVPPAVDPAFRRLRLAALLRAELGSAAPVSEAALLRQARDIAAAIDRLAVEDVPARALLDLDMLPDLAGHWQDSLRTFARVQARWTSECAALGLVDPPERRNRLFDAAARAWRADPPATPIVAAGVTSAAPAVARLLRVIAGLPQGQVILPDLDLALEDAVWEQLGTAGAPPSKDDPPFGRGDAVAHPQYHLKLLLNRMGVARGEVMTWHRSGPGAAPPERSRAISNLFLPGSASAAWVDLPAGERRLSGVRVMETAHPGEEAQAIAVLVREALEEPERRVALVTPDRGLAARVVAHLGRWGIVADDTAGRPLPQTPAGRVPLLLAETLAEGASPVPLVALLGHPLVSPGEDRPGWLDRVRELDIALRGVRPGSDLAAIGGRIREFERRFAGLTAWWEGVAARLAPLFAMTARAPLADWLDRIASVAEDLCGPGLWANADGRALSGVFSDWTGAAAETGIAVAAADLPALLRDLFDEVAVRPPWGGHSRLAIYGLLEARMSRADLVICGGMTEGSWPAAPAPDPLLAPAVLRALGIPGADFRIGLAAHDLAAALGAPEVVLSHAARDEGGPAIPSRFLLRIRAMLGAELPSEARAVALARGIDAAPPAPAYPRPAPRPSREQRGVDLAVTALDRLRGDPYQFYASAILRLKTLDPLDADATPALRGTAVHAILEEWHKGGSQAGALRPIAEIYLETLSSHPFMRGLWRPRLLAALYWIEAETLRLKGEGREPALIEQRGEMRVDGVRVHGVADRIDRLADGSLAVIDYKTGAPPRTSMVEAGYALQLGVIGLIARSGGFKGLAGEPAVFEYWSLGRDAKRGGFGYLRSPVSRPDNKAKLEPDDFMTSTAGFLAEAIGQWINGEEPFTARLNPDLPLYSDYDQLMRLDEWMGRTARAGEGEP